MISVCMIVKDEAESIKAALQSIPQSCEIVIIDTGSTDDTVSICEQFGARIGHFTWINDFSAARNAAIEMASGDYIFMLDADERLEEQAEEKLANYIENSRIPVGTVSIYNYIGDEVHVSRMVRFFANRTSLRYEGAVHERLKIYGLQAEFSDTGVIVHHDGYRYEIYEKKQKLERYEQIYQRELELHPNDGYMLYQFGKLYYSVHRWSEALSYLTRSVQLCEEDKLYYPPLLILYGYTLKALGRSQEAWTQLESYSAKYPAFPDLPFLLGLLAMDTANFQQIEKQFMTALMIGETKHYSSHIGVGSFKAAYNLGVIYEVTGNRALARKYYEQAAKSGFTPALGRLKNM